MARLKPELDHAGADRRIGEAVDDDEAAGVAILAIGIERDRFRGREIAIADLVELERPRRNVLQRIHIDLVLEGGDLAGCGLASRLDQVLPMRKHLFVRHPDYVRGELIGNFGTLIGRNQHVAARDIDLVGENHGHRLTGGRRLEIAVGRHDPRDTRRAARPRHRDRVTRPHRAADDGA